MKITVEVSESRVSELVRQRIAELFSDDARYRDTGARELIRGIVDAAAVSAVAQARALIESELPALAADAVDRAVRADIESAAKRGMGTLRKLYAGRDPAKLPPEQRAWLESQIATAAKAKETP